MKSFRIICIVALIMCLAATSLFARRSRKDYFLRPQVGIWFGPITPILSTADDVETSLGGGAYFRYNLPIRDFDWFRATKIGFDTSYQRYRSEGINELILVPMYANILWKIPINLPIRFQLKAGAGTSWVKIEPDGASQWDPMFMAGIEISFPAGRTFNVGLRIDYLNIYEGHIEGSTKNGHVINTGIMMYFNINADKLFY